MFNYWKNRYIDRGFNPGGMFAKENFCYIPIPKNSSSYIGQLLLANNWEIYNFLNISLQDKICIILLRDPVDRWITGISQYFCSYMLGLSYPANEVINDWSKLTEKLVFDQVIFDDHTETQSYFIKTISLEKCLFIKSLDEPEIKIKKYLNENGLDLNIEVQVDSNKSVGEHRIFVEFFKDMLDRNPYLIDRIKEVYKEDYKLIEQVKFYD